ncbi:pyruvate carboxylase [Rhodotorula toruloides]|uniref:Mitochondrial genome maintenance protein MGM101 n=1 Tax=Rhodotorula toruloides TaxID=5286 RepID=A0A511K7M4_RHOTO|nr:pyruvate carboxylase [Rhodotorula toruloides]
MSSSITRKLTILATGNARAASFSRPSPAHTATLTSSARASFGPDFDPFDSPEPATAAPRAAQSSAASSIGGRGSFAARPSASSSPASSGDVAPTSASGVSPFRPNLPSYGKPVFAPSYALSGEPNPALVWNAGWQDGVDWTTTWKGLGEIETTEEQAAKLMRPLQPDEIQIKPDGILYLPEILYRRILNSAFGPGGWGMVPRGPEAHASNLFTREWGLVIGGKLLSVARGEQLTFPGSSMATAAEACKSNALMRCCKDLGIAGELWDPQFIRKFKADHCVEAWVTHAATNKKARRWRKKDAKFEYPYNG